MRGGNEIHFIYEILELGLERSSSSLAAKHGDI